MGLRLPHRVWRQSRARERITDPPCFTALDSLSFVGSFIEWVVFDFGSIFEGGIRALVGSLQAAVRRKVGEEFSNQDQSGHISHGRSSLPSLLRLAPGAYLPSKVR